MHARIGDNCEIDPSVELRGPPTSDENPPKIGDGATIRSGTIIYPDVVIGRNCTTGHDVLVREATTVGDGAVLGTKTVVDGRCRLGADVSLQTGVYVPPGSELGDGVFCGPSATLTNDPYPLRRDCDLVGPTLEADVSVGANATILPDVTLGERAFVAAGSVVTEDVPPDTLAVGVPAEHRELPPELEGGNR
jgi:acetyltransferase-like isoleucine patch superfamily enzyme